MDKAFKQVVEIVMNKFIEKVVCKKPTAPCPDQYVGTISEFKLTKDGGKGDFPVRIDVPGSDIIKGVKCMIMILESPHTDEFDVGKVPIGPAKGPTGTNIRNAEHWNAVFGEEYREFGLVLVNAIRYQCSLGISTDCVRDEVFIEMWNGGGREEFHERLLKIVKKGDVIANCCTAGKDRKLRELVQAELVNLNNKLMAKGVSKLIRRTHPSSWGRSKKLENKDWNWIHPKDSKSSSKKIPPFKGFGKSSAT
jgi:hypothetical protein